MSVDIVKVGSYIVGIANGAGPASTSCTTICATGTTVRTLSTGSAASKDTLERTSSLRSTRRETTPTHAVRTNARLLELRTVYFVYLVNK